MKIYRKSISQLQSRTKLKISSFLKSSNCPAVQLTLIFSFQECSFCWRFGWFIFIATAFFGNSINHSSVLRSKYLLQKLTVWIWFSRLIYFGTKIINFSKTCCVIFKNTTVMTSWFWSLSLAKRRPSKMTMWNPARSNSFTSLLWLKSSPADVSAFLVNVYYQIPPKWLKKLFFYAGFIRFFMKK